MKRIRKKPIALLMAVLAGAAALCAVCCTDADADGSAKHYDANDYLKYIPELNPGDSVGASMDFDSDDAYQLLKIYAKSFKVPIRWTSEYNQIILRSMQGSSDISDFASSLCDLILKRDGLDADPEVVPKFDSSFAFTLSVTDGKDAPTLVLKMSGSINASVKIKALGEEMIDYTVNIPMALYAGIHMSGENVPTGVDCQFQMSYHLDAKDNTGDEEIVTKDDVNLMNMRCSFDIDSLSVNEVNSVVNGTTDAITKKLYAEMLIESETDDEMYGAGAVSWIQTDISKLGIAETVTEAGSEIGTKIEGVTPSEIKSDVKSLMSGIIPTYDKVEWLMDLAGVSKEDYRMASILALPYLGQAIWILKEIKDYVSDNDLTSYYVKWSNIMIHSEDADKIQGKVADVKTFTPGERPVKLNESYLLDTRNDKASVYRFDYYGQKTSELNVQIPSEIMGKEVTQLNYESFRGENTTKLTIDLPESMTFIPMDAVVGYDYSGIGGTIKYYPENTDYGFTLKAWMRDGIAHATVSGWINGGTTGLHDVTIPSTIEIQNNEVVVDSVSDWAFSNCQELAGITIPESITEIGYGAFTNCNNLETAIIESKDVVFDHTFYGCTSLKTVDVRSKSIYSISNEAFYNVSIDPTNMMCGNETINWISITPNIAENSFTSFCGPGGYGVATDGISYRCWKVDDKYQFYSSYNYDEVELTIPEVIKVTFEDDTYEGTIIRASVSGDSLVKLVIDAPLEYISFSNVPHLMDVKVASQNCSIRTYGDGGFIFIVEDCELLFCNGTGDNINLPDCITDIRYNALPSTAKKITFNGIFATVFNLPDNISTVALGPNVESVSLYSTVSEIIVDQNNEYLMSIDGVLFNNDGELLKYPNGKAGETYILPEECRSIKEFAFNESSLKTITLNSGLSKIEPRAFRNCHDLTSVVVPESNSHISVRNGMLYSDETAIKFIGDANVVILSGNNWGKDIFDIKWPKVVVIEDYTGSFWLNEDGKMDDLIVVIPESASTNYVFDDRTVRYPSSWMYSPEFTTDGKTLRMTLKTNAMLESTGILLDGKAVSDGTTVEFKPEDLVSKSRITISVQPARYDVTFNTSGGPSVPSQKVYYHYCADIPSNPYRSGFTFTGWYADRNCTVAYDFESPIMSDTTIYAGWRVISVTPTDPVTPTQPEKPIENPDGSTTTEKTTTTTDEDGNEVTKVESETKFTDGSKVTSETTTTVKKDGDTTEKITESNETVTDSNGNVSGSTTTTKTEKDDGSEKSTITSTVSKDGEGNQTQITTKVEMESKDKGISTTGEFVKESSGNTSLSIGTSITVDSHADEMSVSSEQMNAAIEQAKGAMDSLGLSDEEKKDADVTVEIKTEKFNDTKASVEMSSESLLSASESNANLKLTSEVGSMTIRKDVSKNLSSKGDNISVSMAVAEKSELAPDVRNRVGDSPVYSLRAVADGESVHELGGIVTVSVKYTLKPGDDPRAITVYYVNDQGKLSKQITSYDPTTHTLTFETSHFSYFMVANSADLADSTENREKDGISMMTAALAAIAVIAVATVVLVMRKRL